MSRGADVAAPGRRTSEWTRRAIKTWAAWRHYLFPAAALAVVGLVAFQARSLDWPAAWRALEAYDLATLALAAALSAAAHLIYTSFDQIGRAYVGHRLARWRVSAIAFASYAFNLNLGTLVGAVGLRMRLYLRYGRTPGDVARIIGLSILTNWLGYAALAGTVFASGLIVLPEAAPISAATLRALGIGLLAISASYLVACQAAARRTFDVRGYRIELPPARIAMLQLALGMLEWAAIGAIPYVLLHGEPGYATTLAALLLAAVAGVLTRVPAGLGVIELVFLWLLGATQTEGVLLAALLVYRVVFYLIPLALAAAIYLVLEASAREKPGARFAD